MAELDKFFNLMIEVGASDLHLASDSQPIVRVRGELERIDHAVLDNDHLKKMLYEIAPEFKVKPLRKPGHRFRYEIAGVARFARQLLQSKIRMRRRLR
jgi:twitching motility protein PilT